MSRDNGHDSAQDRRRPQGEGPAAGSLALDKSGYSRRTFCSWQDAGWSPAESITVDVGDTRVVPQHVTAGWWAPPPPCLPSTRRCSNCTASSACRNRAGRPASRAEQRWPDDIEVEAATRAPGQPAEMIDYRRSRVPHLHGIQLRRPLRRGTRRTHHPPDPRLPRGQHRRLRAGRRPGDRGEPDARRCRLGHRGKPARAQRGRPPLRRLPQRRPGRVRRARQRRCARHRRRPHRHTRSSAERPRRQGTRRGGHGRRSPGHRQRRLPRHRSLPIRLEDNL